MKCFIVILFILTTPALANERIDSYSHAEMRDLATAVVFVVEDMVDNESENTSIDDLGKAAKFNGYIAAYLDFAQTQESSSSYVRACVARRTAVQIAFEVARIHLQQGVNRDVSSADMIAIAVLSYCTVATQSDE